MKYIKKIIKCFYDSNYRQFVFDKLLMQFLKSDSLYLKYLFKKRMGYKLNLKNPNTFNEKLQWLKLYNRKPIYTIMVDKVKAKEYVASIIGNEYIIPTLGVWDKPEDINYDNLPNQFVLKCNHNSGTGMYICKDKSKLDVEAVNEGLRKGLKENYYLTGREWPYKNVKKRILAETFLSDGNDSINDYKLMCFNGKVRCCFVCSERNSDSGLKVTFFDNNWNKLPFMRKYPTSTCEIPKPKKYDEMIVLAEKLSANIPFVRVDFYEVNEQIFFGELTFYPGSGMEWFEPFEWDKTLGEWLELPDKKNRGL